MPKVREDCQRHLVRYVNFINSRPERKLKQRCFSKGMNIEGQVKTKHQLITNGIETKYLYESETLPEGWSFGSTQVHENDYWFTDGKTNIRANINFAKEGWRKGKTVKGFFITNGISAKMIYDEKEIPLGWRKGRIKRTKLQILQAV